MHPECLCDVMHAEQASCQGALGPCHMHWTSGWFRSCLGSRRPSRLWMIEIGHTRWHQAGGSENEPGAFWELIHLCTQGWGARSCASIESGQFVAQYAGELVTSTEAARRLAEIDADPGPTCHALLVRMTPMALLHLDCISAATSLSKHPDVSQ